MHKDNYLENIIIQYVISLEGLKLQACNLPCNNSYLCSIRPPSLHCIASRFSLHFTFINTTSTYIGVESHEVVSYNYALQFSRWNGPQGGPIALKLSQNIVGWWSSHVGISSKVVPVQANQWHSMDTRVLVDTWQASDSSISKSRPVNIWQWCTGDYIVSLLMELSIDDENCSSP